MDKEKRQQKILSLIRDRRVGTQQELAAQLERAGVRLADEVDGELRVVRAAREEDQQPPRVGS